MRPELSGTGQTFIQLGRMPVVISEVVWNEFVGPKVSAKQVPAPMALLTAIAGQQTTIAAQTPSAATFARLHPNLSATQDAGEHSIIALAAHEDTIIPVFRDKGAIHRFIEELPGRMVLSIHGFLGALVREGILPVNTAKAISTLYMQRYVGSPLPLWWPPAAPSVTTVLQGS